MVEQVYQLTVSQVTQLTVIHCILQGLFVSLLTTFFCDHRSVSRPFKTYVFGVHVVALCQTAMQIGQTFDLIESRIPPSLIYWAYPLMTVLLNASVQGFFLFRCWCIFSRRLLPIAPYVLVYLTSIVSGLMMTIYFSTALTADHSHEVQITYMIWIYSAFVLDLSMTTTTIIYVYHSCSGVRSRDGALSAVWQIVWASAAPPLVLMIAVIIVARGVDGVSNTNVIYISNMTGKFFILSLMISLVGRGYIRQKLQALSTPFETSMGPSLPTFMPHTSFRVEMTQTSTDSPTADISQRVSLTRHEQTGDTRRGVTFTIPQFDSASEISRPAEHKESEKP